MLLVDSNIFIYARGDDARTEACREFMAEAASHPEWRVPMIVALELTQYYGDAGEYARKILGPFVGEETELEDLLWASANAPSHSEFNDYVILHSAQRLQCAAVVSYDEIFSRQDQFDAVTRHTPGELT